MVSQSGTYAARMSFILHFICTQAGISSTHALEYNSTLPLPFLRYLWPAENKRSCPRSFPGPYMAGQNNDRRSWESKKAGAGGSRAKKKHRFSSVGLERREGADKPFDSAAASPELFDERSTCAWISGAISACCMGADADRLKRRPRGEAP